MPRQRSTPAAAGHGLGLALLLLVAACNPPPQAVDCAAVANTLQPITRKGLIAASLCVKPGMTRAALEQSFGKPTAIRTACCQARLDDANGLALIAHERALGAGAVCGRGAPNARGVVTGPCRGPDAPVRLQYQTEGRKRCATPFGVWGHCPRWRREHSILTILVDRTNRVALWSFGQCERPDGLPVDLGSQSCARHGYDLGLDVAQPQVDRTRSAGDKLP